jgi:hypothetical protein
MELLSAHLFWDVDRRTVDPERHAPWLVKRVLEHGRWRDWQVVVNYYGRPRLVKIVTKLRHLEPRARCFCQAWLQLPPSSFRCLASTPSRPRFANC